MVKWEKKELSAIVKMPVLIGEWIGEAGEEWAEIACFVAKVMGNDKNCEENVIKRWAGFFPYLEDVVFNLGLSRCYEWKKNNFFNVF